MNYKSEYPGVIHFKKRNNLAYLTFDNPKTLNALSVDAFASLNELFDQMGQDDEILGVILTGAGRSFIAGADLQDPNLKASTPASMPPLNKREQLLYVHNTMNKIANFHRPTIAAINGYALGGGAELSLCCDFRIASSKAKIGFPEGHLGGIPGYTGPTRAVRILGVTAAKLMIYTGKHFLAAEAKELGFVHKVVEPDELIPACEELMGLILKQAPNAVKYGKIICNQATEMSLEACLEQERLLASVLQSTEDFAEGMTAFTEKRDPVFKNR